MPFVSGCGSCPQCHSGNHQVCDNQFQPGFTHWGSFAEYVSIDYADINLVRLPETMDFVTAASLGCRFATSFRAIVDQGRVSAGQWVAVHGCGGVGLSAIMIAKALGAQVVAIDITDEKLDLARSLGAVATVNASKVANVVEAVMESPRAARMYPWMPWAMPRPASTPSPTCASAAAYSGGADAGRHARRTSLWTGHCP